MGPDRSDLIRTPESFGLTGRLTVRTYGPDGQLQDESGNDNVICTAGMSDLLFFLAMIGNPVSGPNYVANAIVTPYASTWGAIGTSTGTPMSTDTALFDEVARSQIGPNASDSTSWTWQFFYGTGSSWIISEGGVFLNATSGPHTGDLLDHSLISPTVPKAADSTAVLEAVFNVVY